VKYTQWFSPDIRPARPGVYELSDRNMCRAWFRYFDGQHWYFGGASAEKAMDYYINSPRANPDPLPWRGLTRKV